MTERGNSTPLVRGKLCVLVPAHNCAPFLDELVRRTPLAGPDDEIVILDDASSDGTFDRMSGRPRVHIERSPKQLGYGGTSKRLYAIAIERGAEYAVNIHGDLAHPPEIVPEIVADLIAGEADIVLGSRNLFVSRSIKSRGLLTFLRSEERNGMPLSRILGHIGITAVQNFLYGMTLHSYHEGLRGVSRPVMEWLASRSLTDWYDFDARLIVAAYRYGWTIKEVAIPPRYVPESISGVPIVRYGLSSIWSAIQDNRFRSGARRTDED